MDTKSEKRRNWIKNIAIIFLTVLLLLTFFSNTIMNYSLPEVSAQYASYGTISSAVKLNGTVTANENYNVYYEQNPNQSEGMLSQTRRVVSVFVKQGDSISLGDPILSLTNGTSDELNSLLKEYDELKSEYDLGLLDDKVTGLNDDKAVADAKQSIADKKEELTKLQTLYNNLLSGTDTTGVIKDQIKAAQNEKKGYEKSKAEIDEKISKLEGEISNAKNNLENDFSGVSLDDRLKEAENNYNTLKAQYDDLGAKVESAKSRLDFTTEGDSDIKEAYEISQTIKGLNSQLAELMKTRSRYIENYYDANCSSNEALVEACRANLAAAQARLDNYNSAMAIKAVNDAYDTAKDALQTSVKDLKAFLNNNGDKMTAITYTAQNVGSAYNQYIDGVSLTNLPNYLSDIKTQINVWLNGNYAYNSGNGDININITGTSGSNSINGEAISNPNITEGSSYSNNFTFNNGETEVKTVDVETVSLYQMALKRVENVENALDAYNVAKGNVTGNTDTTADKLQQAVNNAQAALDEAMSSSATGVNTEYRDFLRQLADYDEDINEIKEQLSDAYAKLNILGMPYIDDVTQYQSSHTQSEAQKEYDKLKDEYTELTEKYNAAKEKYEGLKLQKQYEGTISEGEALLTTYEAQSDAYQDKIDAVNDRIENLNEQLSKAEAGQSQDPDDVKKQIEDKKKEITSAETDLEILKATQDKNDAQLSSSRESQKKKLKELEDKIAEYKDAPENISVTAPISGRIVSVNYVPGSSITSGDLVAQIEISDMGYKCELTVPADQARNISTNSPVSVSNSWWYSGVNASISQIKADPQSQGKNRIIVLTVTGDVYDGQQLTFSIGDKSQSYDTVLPNSAIREDSEGKFVLVVQSKSTPLSTRYTAVRYAVEVMASDETKSAVSGLYGSEFVITNSTSPISDKMQVRLAE